MNARTKIASSHAVRRIAWLGERRRSWQAAKSFGETHAVFEPKIAEWDIPLIRGEAQVTLRRRTPRIEIGEVV